MAPNIRDKGRSPISAEREISFSASFTKVCVRHPACMRTIEPTGYLAFLLTITLPRNVIRAENPTYLFHDHESYFYFLSFFFQNKLQYTIATLCKAFLIFLIESKI